MDACVQFNSCCREWSLEEPTTFTPNGDERRKDEEIPNGRKAVDPIPVVMRTLLPRRFLGPCSREIGRRSRIPTSAPSIRCTLLPPVPLQHRYCCASLLLLLRLRLLLLLPWGEELVQGGAGFIVALRRGVEFGRVDSVDWDLEHTDKGQGQGPGGFWIWKILVMGFRWQGKGLRVHLQLRVRRAILIVSWAALRKPWCYWGAIQCSSITTLWCCVLALRSWSCAERARAPSASLSGGALAQFWFTYISVSRANHFPSNSGCVGSSMAYVDAWRGRGISYPCTGGVLAISKSTFNSFSYLRVLSKARFEAVGKIME